MTDTATMPWQITVWIVCLIIDIICIPKLLKNEWRCEHNLRNLILVLGIGIVIYFTVGWIWYIEPTHLNIYVPRDPDPTTPQIGMIVVALAPGSLIAWILTWLEFKKGA